MIDGLTYVKRQLTRAEHLRNARRYDDAHRTMLSIFREFNDHGEQTTAAYFRPRAYHQMALIHEKLGDNVAAGKYFDSSLKEFESDNYIGRGRLMRDYAWWTYNQDDTTEGVKLLNDALQLLMQDRSSQRRRQREITVTQGFIARTRVSTHPEEARSTLLRVDEELRGGDKWMYELDNLEYLIPLLSLSQRPPFLARAKKIKMRILFHENLAVLGGDIKNGRLFSGLTDFSINSIKSFV